MCMIERLNANYSMEWLIVLLLGNLLCTNTIKSPNVLCIIFFKVQLTLLTSCNRYINSLHFFILLFSSAVIFQHSYFKRFFQEYYQSVK